MKLFLLNGICLTILGCASINGPADADEGSVPHYEVIQTIAGPDSRWDLASVDAERHRLYLARVGGVAALDLLTAQVMPSLVSAPLMHGVVPVGSTAIVVASDARQNAVVWFDGGTGKIQARTQVGTEPDTVVYDGFTGSVISINAKDLTVISAATLKVVATVPLPGEPEFAVTDGKGLLFDNIRDRHEIAVVDLRQPRGVVKHFALTHCEEPTGLAYDAQASLLISVCGSGVVKVLAASDGQDLATVTVGAGADAVILDAARRLVFIPSGHSGTLSIISLANPNMPLVVQTLKTPIGTRTGALDPNTGRLYLPSAEFGPKNREEWPPVIPGTMKFLVVAPRVPAVSGDQT